MTRDNDLQEQIDMLDMESYFDREGITFKRTIGSRGPQLNVRQCPVCGNSKWKVYINADTGQGNCFAGDHPAGEHFNKWSFIKAYLGTASTKQVADHIKVVAGELGWHAPRRVSVATNKVVAGVKLPESFPLPIGGRNLKYLDNRGISGEMSRYFDLRFCQKGHFEYVGMNDKRYKMDFDSRIIIPVFDLEGELVTFQGRDITGTAEKKYMFPPGLAGTGRFLYNGQNAVGAKRIVVGEGAFDVIAAKIALDGDMNLRDVVPVGTFGKHLSTGMGDARDQLGAFIKLREAGLEEAVFMWDGEVGATDAAVLAGLLLKGAGIKVRLAYLPADKDPNEIAAEAVRKAFYEARPITMATGAAAMLKRRAGT